MKDAYAQQLSHPKPLLNAKKQRPTTAVARPRSKNSSMGLYKPRVGGKDKDLRLEDKVSQLPAVESLLRNHQLFSHDSPGLGHGLNDSQFLMSYNNKQIERLIY